MLDLCDIMQQIKVTGMTCEGCASSIKRIFEESENISFAVANPLTGDVQIKGDRELKPHEIQTILSDYPHYSLVTEGAIQDKSTGFSMSTYWPLILIFGFLIPLTAFTSFGSGSNRWMTWMAHFMGAFFLTFAFFKLLDIRGFASSYQAYDILARKWPTYGLIYPFLELALGMAWIAQAPVQWTAGATVVLMGFSAIGVIQAVVDKKTIRCACLGSVFQLPMSTVTIVEDLLMVGMAAITLFLSI